MTSLQGKLALVTRAAGVLGFATAKRLSEEGMRVVLVDIDSERLEECSYGAFTRSTFLIWPADNYN